MNTDNFDSYKCRNHSFLHFCYLALSLMFIFLGLCHLAAEYFVVQYAHIMHVDFNSLDINPQMVSKSWVRSIGVILVTQGVLMINDKKWKEWGTIHNSYLSITLQVLLDLGIVIVLYNNGLNFHLFLDLPSVILIMIHLVFQIISLLLKTNYMLICQ